MLFNGKSDVIDCGADFLGDGEFTISFFMKILKSDSYEHLILNNGKTQIVYKLDDDFDYLLVRNNLSETTVNTPTSSLTKNIRHHIIISRNSSGEVSIYIDRTKLVDEVSAGTLTAGTTNTLIGGAGTSTSDLSPCAFINNLKIYSSELTESQILSIFDDNEPITDDLSIFYRLDEANAYETTVLDLSGNDNTGTSANSIIHTYRVRNEEDYTNTASQSFNKESIYLLYSDATSDLNFSGSFSIVARVKLNPENNPDPSKNWVIVSNEALNNYGYTFRINGTTLKPELRTSHSGGHSLATATNPISANEWVSLIVVYDSVSESVVHYLNGEVNGELTSIENPTLSLNNITVSSASSSNKFEGLMYDLRFYDAVLGNLDIKKLSNGINVTNNLVGLYLLDDLSFSEDNQQVDLSFNSNNLDISIKPESITTIDVDSDEFLKNIIAFDNNYASTATSTLYNLGQYSEFTISCQVKTTVENATLAACGRGAGEMDGWELSIAGGKVKMEADTTTDGGTHSFTNTGSIDVDDDAWHSIIFSFDGTNGSIYVDSVLDNSEEGTFPDKEYTFYIGKNTDGNVFSGYIYDLRIYTEFLDANSVINLYNKEYFSRTNLIGQWLLAQNTCRDDEICDTTVNNNSLTFDETPSFEEFKLDKTHIGMYFNGDDDCVDTQGDLIPAGDNFNDGGIDLLLNAPLTEALVNLGDELIVNGGLEAGDTTGWRIFNAGTSAGTISINAILPISGSYDLKAEITSIDLYRPMIRIPNFTQALSIGKSYKISSSFKAETGTTEALYNLRIMDFGSIEVTYFLNITTDVTNYDQFRRILNYSCTGLDISQFSDTNTFYIDDASCKEYWLSDLSPNARHLSPANEPTWNTLASGLKVMNFNGTTDLIDTGSDFIGTGARTFEAWIRKESGGGGGLGRIITNGKLIIYVNNFNRVLISNDGGSTVLTAPQNTLLDNTWTHIVIVRDAAGQSSIYKNGGLSISGDGGTPAAGSTNVFIGNRSTADLAFDGDISNMRVYDGILTPDQIYQRYCDTRYLYTSSQTTRTSSDMSISFRMKPISWGEDESAYILSNGSFIVKLSNYEVLNVTSDGETWTNFPVGTIPLNHWSHICITRKLNGKINVYLNNELYAEENVNTGTPLAGSTNLIIGNDALLEKTFDGYLSDVRLFDKILNSEEIYQLYCGISVTDSLIMHYPLDPKNVNLSPLSINDTINATNGIPTNTPIFVAEDSFNLFKLNSFGKSLATLYMNGVDDYINVGKISEIDLDSTCTISVTVKSDDVLRRQGIIGMGNPYEIGGKGFILAYCGDLESDKSIRLILNNGTGLPLEEEFTVGSINDEWHTIVLVLDRSDLSFFYYDGVLKGSFDTTDKSTNTINANNLYVGKYGESTDEYYFKGSFANFKLFNRGLTSEEVSTLYSNPFEDISGNILDYSFLPIHSNSTTIFDISGHGLDGTLNNEPVFQVQYYGNLSYTELEPPRQKSLIENFSPDTIENLKNITKVLWGKLNIDYGPYLDLEYQNGIINKDDSFDLTIDETEITISEGIGLVRGTMIETTESVTLDVNDLEDSYIFADDTLPINATDYLYLVLYHNPSAEDSNAYIGLVYDIESYSHELGNMAILSVLQVSVSGELISSIDDTLVKKPDNPDIKVWYLTLPRTGIYIDAGLIEL